MLAEATTPTIAAKFARFDFGGWSAAPLTLTPTAMRPVTLWVVVAAAATAALGTLGSVHVWRRRRRRQAPDCHGPCGATGIARTDAALGAPAVAATLPPLVRRPWCTLVGESKMVYIPSLSAATGCTVLAKVEFLGFGGTSKDRIAARIVSDAERSGALQPGGVIVEGTSGSTGISLAFVARARGYRCRIYMPDDQVWSRALRNCCWLLLLVAAVRSSLQLHAMPHAPGSCCFLVVGLLLRGVSCREWGLQGGEGGTPCLHSVTFLQP